MDEQSIRQKALERINTPGEGFLREDDCELNGEGR